MIDLETWGNRPNSVVVQIGACYFSRDTGKIGSKFNIKINAETEINEGFEVDASTIYWWLDKSKEAQLKAHGLKHHRKRSVNAWNDFNNFTKDANYVWSHATFDFVIMMNHFHKLNINPKVHYRSARDIRTLVDLAGDIEWKERTGVHHDALDDAIFQVSYCVDCLKKIKGVK
jgi:hypothetical protein